MDAERLHGSGAGKFPARCTSERLSGLVPGILAHPAASRGCERGRTFR